MSIERILWIDRMRGLLMLSVVIQHLSIYNISNASDFVFLRWIGIANMSAFFFVSAYLMVSTSKIDNFTKQGIFLLNKTRQLIIPFLLWPLVINKFFFQTNWPSVGLNDFVNEFLHPKLWFFLTLYGFCFIFIVFSFLDSNGYKKLSLISIFIICLILSVLFIKFHSFKNAALYCWYFVFGIIVSKYNLLYLVKNKYILSFSLLVVLLSLMFWNSGQTSVLNISIKLAVSLATISVIYFLCSSFYWNKIIDRLILPLGKYSLSIYVVHWAFISFFSTKIAFFYNELFAIILISIIGLIISYSCIGVYKFTYRLPIISFIFWGNK